MTSQLTATKEDYKNVCFSLYIDTTRTLIRTLWHVHLVSAFTVFHGITNPKTVFISRFTRTVNCYTTWMVKTRTLPAGCVLFNAHAPNTNRIFLRFNTEATFIIVHSRTSLLEKNFLFGMMINIFSILEYRQDCRKCALLQIMEVRL